MSQLLQLFQTAGPDAFTSTVCQVAPYFSSIQPRVTALRPGFAEATVPLRREGATVRVGDRADLVLWSRLPSEAGRKPAAPQTVIIDGVPARVNFDAP